MNLRKMHRTVAILFSPFLLLTATSGAVLLFRKAGLYEYRVEDALLGLHNWEIVAHYVGLVLAAGLITIVVTGVTIFTQMQVRVRRARRKK